MMFARLYNRMVFTVTLISLFFFGVQIVAAQTTNEQITFYGTLQDSSGNDLDGIYDMVFRFYDAPTAGTQLDTNTHTTGNGNPVVVNEGEFAVVLGSGAGNTLDGLDFNTDGIYVGVSIEGGAEASPRTRLSSAAYAINSDKLDGCDAPCYFRNNATGTVATLSSDTLLTIRQDGSGDILNLRDGGTEVLTVLDGGRVGFGTSSPTQTMVVDGSFQLTGSFYDSSDSAGTSGDLITSSGAGTLWAATSTFGGGAGSSLFTDAGDFTYLTATTNYLAIGTTTSRQRLSIANGNLNVTSNGSLYLDDRRMLYGSSTGVFGMGWGAGSRLDTGLHNLSFGYLSGGGYKGSGNNYNIFMGTIAGTFASSSQYTVAMGREAGKFVSGDHNFYVGLQSGVGAVGNYNFGFGQGALSYVEGDFNVAVGHYAGAYDGGGNANVILGPYAAQDFIGDNNVLLGDSSAAFASTFGRNDHAIVSGYEAGANAIGEHNIFFGSDAGVVSGRNGYGDGNIFVGFSAFEWTETGAYNVGIGYNVGNELEASSSVIIGASAFSNPIDPVATNNTSLGVSNFRNVTTGAHNNIALGPNVNTGFANPDRSIIIGDNINFWTSGTDILTIGNLLFATSSAVATGTTLSSGNAGIGTNAPTAQLHTTGSVRLSNFPGPTTLLTDASGNVTVSSDEHLKDIEAFYVESIDALMGIEPIVYRWNATSGYETLTEYIGFSAQNVQEYIPGAVGQSPNGFLTLSDRGILATVVNAVKELFVQSKAVASTTESLSNDVAGLANDSSVQKDWTEHIGNRIETLEAELRVDQEMFDENLRIDQVATTTATTTESAIEYDKISSSSTATTSPDVGEVKDELLPAVGAPSDEINPETP